ncbi:hypothetical protein HETIRDRAFT_106689 [Heterobasidion irregulare TC 32-1]|uniref:Uncharacterized protein n=1 Tax=Heterobasidion irregulare (strain TC 32-1) TaxID=747525 RepID=W4JRK3_HETIT|nr:uncharacterized protein HETIRDRAFT_106689 [Heterobasidion irregulare TC 32-1]ETW76094.1 hypothetical protein HETIRDRAFT_106689 [Heterobasidion irregulare TC 32-1]
MTDTFDLGQIHPSLFSRSATLCAFVQPTSSLTLAVTIPSSDTVSAVLRRGLHHLSQSQLDNLHTQLAQFRAALTHFATHRRADIQRDPRFRHAFQQMCTTIGVDPLAGPRR